MKRAKGKREIQQPILIFLWLFLTTTFCYGQNCTQILKRAQLTYDEGRIAEVPGILEACLKDGFNKEERAAAYRLLTLTYLYLDEPAKADESMLKLLRTNHEYKINTSVDPTEFINLYNRFRTNPIYRIGIKGGGNWMRLKVIDVYSLNGDEKIENIKVKSSAGFQIGISSEIPLKGKFEFSPELLFSSREYKFNYSVAGQDGNYTEKLLLFDVPLLIKYNLGSKNYIPYINAGIQLDYLLASSGNTIGDPVSPTTSFAYQRSSLVCAAVLGAGIKNRMGPGILSVGFRIAQGLNDLVIDRARYGDNGSFSMSFGVVASQLRLTTHEINVSYIIPIYNPKKVR